MDRTQLWIERRGRLKALQAPSLDAEVLERAAIQIARPLKLDPVRTPLIDARLADGSRVAISTPPASPVTVITIRRFGDRHFSARDLVNQKALPADLLEQIETVLASRHNILISGGTGSGKTTMLNALIELLPATERIITIEDTLELRVTQPNHIRFEARSLEEKRPSLFATWFATPSVTAPTTWWLGEVPRQRSRRLTPGPQHRPWRLAHYHPRQ